MLQLIDIEMLVPGMFVVKVTKPVGKIKITTPGILKDLKSVQTLVNKDILQIQIDLSKSTHIDITVQDTSDEDYCNYAGLTYDQQLAHALELYDQVKTIQGRLIKQFAKGKITDLEAINDITEQIVNQAFECDDALAIVTLLKSSDEYLMEHSINCAILIVMFGRALGMSKTTLHHMGVGALLMDIGMVKLPLLLTQKPSSLSPQETQRMHSHIDIGLKLVEPISEISETSVLLVKQHHERMDGSGYPDGLRGEQISIYAKLAAIVDTYDSLTTSRPYRDPLKPADALQKLVDETLGLDMELVEKFIQCIGANPVGSMVKLASGKLAVVMRLNKTQPLSPVVMTFYNLTTKLDEVAQINLSKSEDEIVSSISPDDFNKNL
jgi:HD-GYP domain-containing protein (c-di-GMP phosphodiesterase class II)